MSNKSKIIIGVCSVFVVFAVVLTLYLCWPAIEGTINGSRYYTEDDVQSAYDEGYSDGITNKDELTSQVEAYKLLIEQNEITISELNKTISSLQSQISQLQFDLTTSENLTEEQASTITSLQSQVLSLQETVSELENTVTYYEKLLEAYGNSDKLIVTFVLVDNGEQTVYDVQTVDENNYLSPVVTPSGDFEGWTLTIGGQYIEDLTTIQVIENMTIYGIFSNSVTYVVQGEITTETIEYNGTISKTVDLKNYTFLGWSLTENGEILSSDYTITQDTTLYAILEKNLVMWQEMTWNGLSNFNGQYVWTDGIHTYYSNGDNQYILNTETSTWEEINWNIAIDSISHIWTDGINTYYSYGEEQYILDTETYTWNIMTWKGFTDIRGQYIWTDGTNIYYSVSGAYYVLNVDTSTWEPITSNKEFWGTYVWTDGIHTYYSNGDNQYILNTETFTWEEMNWNITISSCALIWSDGTSVYYSDGDKEQYILNTETSTWEEMNWEGFSNIKGSYIWTDGTNIYYSYGPMQYKLV